MLWLFTDPLRLPDPLAAVAGLPRGAGVVLRGGDAALAGRVAALCRLRGLALVVAGDARLAAARGAGLHLRRGRRAGVLPPRGLLTSSAHDVAEIIRARRAGAEIIFISPAFATASHPGAAALGAVRWRRLARLAGGAAYALGGVTGGNIRSLGRACRGVGAISALA